MNPTYTYTFSIPPMPVTEPLRLEAGKSYLNRRGEVVGPMSTCVGGYYAYPGSDVFHDNGRYTAQYEDPRDLITEHIAPQSEEDSKSKTVTETFGVPLGKDGPKLEPVAEIPATTDFPAVQLREVYEALKKYFKE